MDEILVVAEKPSVARDIARVLGASARGEGRLTGGGYVVTWAIGHLVALKEPEELDARYKRWRAEDLPILPEHMQLKVLPKTRAQFARGQKAHEQPGDPLHHLRDGLRARRGADLPLHL